MEKRDVKRVAQLVSAIARIEREVPSVDHAFVKAVYRIIMRRVVEIYKNDRDEKITRRWWN